MNYQLVYYYEDINSMEMSIMNQPKENLFAGHTYGLPLFTGPRGELIAYIDPPQADLVGKSCEASTMKAEDYWVWWTDLMTASEVTGNRADAVFSMANLDQAQRAIFIGYGTGGDVLWMLNREDHIPLVATGVEPDRRAFELSLRVFETLSLIVNGKSATESFDEPGLLLSKSHYTPGLADIIHTAQMAIPKRHRDMALKTSGMYGRIPLETFLAGTATKLDTMIIEPIYTDTSCIGTIHQEDKSTAGIAIAYSTKAEPDITRYLYLFHTQYPNPILLNQFVETATGPVASIALGVADNWPALYYSRILPAVIEESRLAAETGYTHAATFQTRAGLNGRDLLVAIMQRTGRGTANQLLGTGVNIQEVDRAWMDDVRGLGAGIHHRKGSSHILVYKVK